MWSRLASRVLKPIHTYEIEFSHDARDVAEELYEGALNFDWSLIFAPKAPLPFVYMSNVKLKSILSLQHLRVKDGVVDSFMEAVGRVQVLILNNLKLPLCIGR
jgi:23S rRNA (guanine2445-N2)-methyltransferase / 23S rRNA (guanine2069-N7)-methyltransferase